MSEKKGEKNVERSKNDPDQMDATRYSADHTESDKDSFRPTGVLVALQFCCFPPIVRHLVCIIASNWLDKR